MVSKINLSKRISEIRHQRSSNVIALVNGHAVKLARRFGKPDWTRNDQEDEVFISFVGQQRIQLRDETIELNEGELVVIPKGVEYRPVPMGHAELLTI